MSIYTRHTFHVSDLLQLEGYNISGDGCVNIQYSIIKMQCPTTIDVFNNICNNNNNNDITKFKFVPHGVIQNVCGDNPTSYSRLTQSTLSNGVWTCSYDFSDHAKNINYSVDLVSKNSNFGPTKNNWRRDNGDWVCDRGESSRYFIYPQWCTVN